MATWRVVVIWQCARCSRNRGRKNTYTGLGADVGTTNILERNQFFGVVWKNSRCAAMATCVRGAGFEENDCAR